MATKQSTKQAPAKQAAKAPAKQAPATLVYAAILADALAGKMGANVQRFYVNAIAYHRKQATVFPRGRLAGVPLMDDAKAREWIAARAVAGIPAGSHEGQRLFDQMMIEAASK